MTSIIGIGDLLRKDFLQKVNLKPWWEKFRSYANTLAVGAALFMTWITTEINQTTVCLPVAADNGTSDNYSGERANFIGTYCDIQLVWYIVYPGLSSLCAILVLNFFANMWSISPCVLHTVMTFKEAEGSYRTYKKEDSEESKRKARDLLKKLDENARNCCCSIRGIYFFRNVAILLLTAAISVLGGFICRLLYNDENQLECKLPNDVQYYETWKVALGGHDTFVCSYKDAYRLLPPAALFTSSSILEFICILIGTVLMAKKVCCTRTNRGRRKNSCRYFMKTFRRHCRGTADDGFLDFIDKTDEAPRAGEGVSSV